MLTPKKYQRAKLACLILRLLAEFTLLALFLRSGLSGGLKRWALTSAQPWALQTSAYLAVFFSFFYLTLMPFDLYSGLRLEKKFHLSNQTYGAWAWDEIKKYLLGGFFFIFTNSTLLFLIRHWPRHWWLLAALGWLFVSVFLTHIFPVILIPLFYPTRTLSDNRLNQRLLELAQRCGVRIRGIFEISLSLKTRKANAALTGIGNTRRILLGDTLLKNYSTEEIEMVTAHEIGHHVRHHVSQSIALSFAGALGGFYALSAGSEPLCRLFRAENLADLSFFPVLVALGLAANLLILPCQNAFSRRQEYAADAYALKMLPYPTIFESLMNKLASQNLADTSPPALVEFIFYDHPSVDNRIRRVRAPQGAPANNPP